MDGDAVGVCVISGDHVFDFEEESGEAFCNEGGGTFTYHRNCLHVFVKTGELDSCYTAQISDEMRARAKAFLYREAIRLQIFPAITDIAAEKGGAA